MTYANLATMGRWKQRTPYLTEKPPRVQILAVVKTDLKTAARIARLLRRGWRP